MDKYEYTIKSDKIKKLVDRREYEMAARIADTIDWEKVKNAKMLSAVSTAYEKAGRYQEARDILLLAYECAPVGRRFLYKLTELAAKQGNFEEAEDYLQEYADVSPHDPGRLLLRYEIAKNKGEPPENLIMILEAYHKRDFDERWSYELAELYYNAGKTEQCVKLCDEIVLWFGVGSYVDKALELKQRVMPLSPDQIEKQENREKYLRRLEDVRREFEGDEKPETKEQPAEAAQKQKNKAQTLEEQISEALKGETVPEKADTVSQEEPKTKRVSPLEELKARHPEIARAHLPEGRQHREEQQQPPAGSVREEEAEPAGQESAKDRQRPSGASHEEERLQAEMEVRLAREIETVAMSATIDEAILRETALSMETMEADENDHSDINERTKVVLGHFGEQSKTREFVFEARAVKQAMQEPGGKAETPKAAETDAAAVCQDEEAAKETGSEMPSDRMPETVSEAYLPDDKPKRPEASAFAHEEPERAAGEANVYEEPERVAGEAYAYEKAENPDGAALAYEEPESAAQAYAYEEPESAAQAYAYEEPEGAAVEASPYERPERAAVMASAYKKPEQAVGKVPGYQKQGETAVDVSAHEKSEHAAVNASAYNEPESASDKTPAYEESEQASGANPIKAQTSQSRQQEIRDHYVLIACEEEKQGLQECVAYIRRMRELLGCPATQLAKIKGDRLAQKDIGRTLKKLEGRDLVVVGIEELSDSILEQMIEAVARDQTESFIALVDTAAAIKKLRNRMQFFADCRTLTCDAPHTEPEPVEEKSGPLQKETEASSFRQPEEKPYRTLAELVEEAMQSCSMDAILEGREGAETIGGVSASADDAAPPVTAADEIRKRRQEKRKRRQIPFSPDAETAEKCRLETAATMDELLQKTEDKAGRANTEKPEKGKRKAEIPEMKRPEPARPDIRNQDVGLTKSRKPGAGITGAGNRKSEKTDSAMSEFRRSVTEKPEARTPEEIKRPEIRRSEATRSESVKGRRKNPAAETFGPADAVSSNKKHFGDRKRDSRQEYGGEWDEGQPEERKWDDRQPGEREWDDSRPEESEWGDRPSGESEWDDSRLEESEWVDRQPGEREWDDGRPEESEWDDSRPEESEWDDSRPEESEWDDRPSGEREWDDGRPEESEWDDRQPGDEEWDGKRRNDRNDRQPAHKKQRQKTQKTERADKRMRTEKNSSGRGSVQKSIPASEGMSANDFFEFAVDYAHMLDAVIDDMGSLAFYAEIEQYQQDRIPLTEELAQEMVEKAILRAEKRSFKGLFSNRYDKEGYLILKEEHFKE